jgi:predicted DNA-binding transcriptional regulator AlpA
MSLMTDKELARMFGVTVQCVKKWRRERRGPKYLKVEGSVRYVESDVHAYLRSCEVLPSDQSTPQPAAQ